MRKMGVKEEVSVMWRTPIGQAEPDLSPELAQCRPSVSSAVLATATLTELASLLGRNAARCQRRGLGLATFDTALVLLAAALVAASLLLSAWLLGRQ